MNANSTKTVPNALYRCAGPNCGIMKGSSDRWWLMWTSFGEFNQPVLYLCSWDEEIAQKEGTLHVCGELCAQRLQSHFMGNVRENNSNAKAVDLRACAVTFSALVASYLQRAALILNG